MSEILLLTDSEMIVWFKGEDFINQLAQKMAESLMVG